MNNTYFSSGNNTATCTSPAAMAARVLASAAKVVADNLAVIQDQQIGDETSPASFAAERSLHIHEIAVDIGDEIGQEEREHISPGHNSVNHIGGGPLKQCVRPKNRTQNRGQFGCYAVKNQRQQIGEGKLQQRDTKGYQVKLYKLPKGTVTESGVELSQ